REHHLLLARRLEREVQPYRQAIAVNPKDNDARLQLGTVYARNGIVDVAARQSGTVCARKGSVAGAEREFDAILAQEPKHASALNNRGNLYFASGDFERALEAYRVAQEAAPQDGGIRLNAALAYYRLGKLPEARAKFKEATQLKGDLGAQYAGFAK